MLAKLCLLQQVSFSLIFKTYDFLGIEYVLDT